MAADAKRRGSYRDSISYTMSRIRGKDTSSELKLRRALWNSGLRFRKHYKQVPGSPDIAFVRAKVAVFCDGIFWHGRDWEQRKLTLISKSRDYWIRKIEANMARDERVNKELISGGWLVIRIWEDEIISDIDNCVERIRKAVTDRKRS